MDGRGKVRHGGRRGRDSESRMMDPAGPAEGLGWTRPIWKGGAGGRGGARHAEGGEARDGTRMDPVGPAWPRDFDGPGPGRGACLTRRGTQGGPG